MSVLRLSHSQGFAGHLWLVHRGISPSSAFKSKASFLRVPVTPLPLFIYKDTVLLDKGPTLLQHDLISTYYICNNLFPNTVTVFIRRYWGLGLGHVFFFFPFFFFFLAMNVACGILVPQPGIEPGPLEVEAQSPNHWSIREPLLGHLSGGAQCDPLQSPKQAALSAPTFCPNQLSPRHLTPTAPEGIAHPVFPGMGMDTSLPSCPQAHMRAVPRELL